MTERLVEIGNESAEEAFGTQPRVINGLVCVGVQEFSDIGGWHLGILDDPEQENARWFIQRHVDPVTGLTHRQFLVSARYTRNHSKRDPDEYSRQSIILRERERRIRYFSYEFNKYIHPLSGEQLPVCAVSTRQWKGDFLWRRIRRDGAYQQVFRLDSYHNWKAHSRLLEERYYQPENVQPGNPIGEGENWIVIESVIYHKGMGIGYARKGDKMVGMGMADVEIGGVILTFPSFEENYPGIPKKLDLPEEEYILF